MSALAGRLAGGKAKGSGKQIGPAGTGRPPRFRRDVPCLPNRLECQLALSENVRE